MYVFIYMYEYAMRFLRNNEIWYQQRWLCLRVNQLTVRRMRNSTENKINQPFNSYIVFDVIFHRLIKE